MAPIALGLSSRQGRVERRSFPALVIACGLIPSLVTAWIMWVAPVENLTAERTALAGRDFTAFWTAGRMAATHAVDTLADPAGFTAYLRTLFGSGMPDQIWPYPPPMLLLAQPFASLSLGFSFLVYVALTLAALAGILRFSGLSAGPIAAILLSPAVATSILAGQNGVLIAALMSGGLLLIDRRPVIAGLLLGALFIKPQFALLLPICFWAGRQKLAALVSCATACSLALLSVQCFGLKPWVDFLSRNWSTVRTYVGAPWQSAPVQTNFTSVFMAARSVGAELATAYPLQAIAICACAFAAWKVWADHTLSTERRCAATMALALSTAPWVHTYDMPALAVAIVLILWRGRTSKRSLLGWAYIWPGLSSLLPISPLVSMLTVGSVAVIAMVPFCPTRAASQPA